MVYTSSLLDWLTWHDHSNSLCCSWTCPVRSTLPRLIWNQSEPWEVFYSANKQLEETFFNMIQIAGSSKIWEMFSLICLNRIWTCVCYIWRLWCQVIYCSLISSCNNFFIGIAPELEKVFVFRPSAGSDAPNKIIFKTWKGWFCFLAIKIEAPIPIFIIIKIWKLFLRFENYVLPKKIVEININLR